jgi:hypothetical protein
MSMLAKRPILCMVAGIIALNGVAHAQTTTISPVEPYWVVVGEGDAVLRSGPGDLMYPVLKLRPGQLLRVDGEGADVKGKPWNRVSYPQGSYVLVPVDAVQTEPGGAFGGLTKPVAPKAPNMMTGLSGSWSPVVPQALPAGTRLTIIEGEMGRDGKLSAYRVAPPEAARAFAPAGSLRRATPDEIASAAGAATAPGTNLAGASQARPQAPAPTPQPGPTGGGNLADPIQPGAGAAPSAPTTTTASGAETPTVIEQKPAPVVVVPPNPYEKLEAAFNAVRAQPVEQAEVSELIAEYQAEIAKLDESPGSRSMRGRLNSRVEFLRVIEGIQASRRALAESEQFITIDERKLAERLREVDRTRQYTIVGRLSASTIYDGKRLPLMYRVQTVGGAAPRTLAYIKPDEKLSIDSKLGTVVGVIGEARMDPTLKLNIITPLRVDALEAAAETVTTKVETDEN